MSISYHQWTVTPRDGIIMTPKNYSIKHDATHQLPNLALKQQPNSPSQICRETKMTIKSMYMRDVFTNNRL